MPAIMLPMPAIILSVGLAGGAFPGLLFAGLLFAGLLFSGLLEG